MRSFLTIILTSVHLLCCNSAFADGLAIYPPNVRLNGRAARCQMVVTCLSRQITSDATHIAKYRILNPHVATVTASGLLLPVQDGKTEVVIEMQGRSARAAVIVSGVMEATQWTFQNHIEAILTKQACNSGPCHGAAAGKGGFRLSLRGYDPVADYERLRFEGLGRRIVKQHPGESLLLSKPSLKIAHQGGLKLRRDSLEYRVLSEWIAAGAPGPASGTPKLDRVDVYPRERLLAVGARQQLQVTAVFSDGHREDVTHWAKFASNEDPIVRVDDGGLAQIVKQGETAVTVTYLGKVAFVRLGSAFSTVKESGASKPSDSIDYHVNRKLHFLGLSTSPVCTDREFIRRVSLDLIGVLPKPAEIEEFLKDHRVDKREAFIDSLLQRPEFTDFWTYRFAELLRVNRDLVGRRGIEQLNSWLRQCIANDVGWDQMASDLITAQGSSAQNPAAQFYRMGEKPEEFAENVAQTFLGIRVQCAHCHNHPFEKWTQSDYYRMANLFSRVRRADAVGGTFIMVSQRGDVDHPKLHHPLEPAAFDGPKLALTSRIDRREALSDWLVGPDNPYFARAMVNRVWKHFMGRGLVEPVDDMRFTNPATNEPLLAFLSRRFVQGGYRLLPLIADIVRSQAYQRSVRPVAGNRLDDRFYSRYLPKRISAEVLLDAICAITEVPEKFPGNPGARAVQLPDTRIASSFLDAFGRPARQVACECERAAEPTIAQALHLVNSDFINSRVRHKSGIIARLISEKRSDNEIVTTLYLSTLGRLPRADERKRVELTLGTDTKQRTESLADLLWALLSSSEFQFNH